MKLYKHQPTIVTFYYLSQRTGQIKKTVFDNNTKEDIEKMENSEQLSFQIKNVSLPIKDSAKIFLNEKDEERS